MMRPQFALSLILAGGLASQRVEAEPLHASEHHHDIWSQIEDSERFGHCLPPAYRPWETYGLKIEGAYIGQALWNLRGGLGQGTSPAWLNLGDLYVEWSHQEETPGLTLPPGGQLGAHFLWFTDNGNFSAEEIGSWQPVRSAEARDFSALEELWYRQSLADDQLWIKLGKFEPYNEIAFSETAANFAAAYFTSLANAPLPTYPWTGVGAVAGAKLPLDLSVQALGMMNGYDSRTYSGLGHEAIDTDNGATAVAELAWTPELVPGYPSSLKAGGWFANATFDPETQSRDDDDRAGGYLVFDQRLVNQGEGAQTIDLFAKISATPSRQHLQPVYWATGALFSGWVPRRPRDDIGLAVSSSEFSAAARQDNGYPHAENIIEAFYCVHLTECFFVRPTLSYVRQPAEAVAEDRDDEAWVLGVMVELSF